MAGTDDSHDPEAIRPDEVSAGGSRPSGDGRGGSGRGDLDGLARRAVDSVLHLVQRANALARGVLLFSAVCCVGGFLLGLAALSDGIRSVWIVIGGFFMVLSIGSVITAMWRLRSVRRGADTLVDEVRSLIESGGQTVRNISETVTTTERRSDDGIVELSREFVTIRGEIGDRVGQFRALASAISAVTTFPGLVALATVIGFFFLGLSFIFAIALAL